MFLHGRRKPGCLKKTYMHGRKCKLQTEMPQSESWNHEGRALTAVPPYSLLRHFNRCEIIIETQHHNIKIRYAKKQIWFKEQIIESRELVQNKTRSHDLMKYWNKRPSNYTSSVCPSELLCRQLILSVPCNQVLLTSAEIVS